jgi:valyl-tRNA synthetase
VKSRLQGDGPSKQTAQQTLAFVLDGILKLLHPFMPHITEEVWHTLNQAGDEENSWRCSPIPTVLPGLIDQELEQQFALLFDTVRTIRNLRAEAGIKPSTKLRPSSKQKTLKSAAFSRPPPTTLKTWAPSTFLPYAMGRFIIRQNQPPPLPPLPLRQPRQRPCLPPRPMP